MPDEKITTRFNLPFNTYDIFGYIIPAATFLLGCIFYEYILYNQHIKPDTLYLPLLYIVNIAINSALLNLWVIWLLYFLLFLYITYLVGHIVSSASSLLIDRILIFKCYGYPYERLLRIRSNLYPYSSSYYKGLFFWVNAYLVLRYLNITYYNMQILKDIANILGIFIIFIVIAKVFSSHIRNHTNNCLYEYFYIGVGRHIRRIAYYILVNIFPLPHNIITSCMSNFINSNETFDDTFRDKYFNSFKRHFKYDPCEARSNNYWFAYCYVADQSSIFNRMITNWLHLYSFSRNLSMAFYMSFIYCFFSIWYNIVCKECGNFGYVEIIPIIYLILSLIMLFRFYYLYHSYYSKFILRSFVYLSSINKV